MQISMGICFWTKLYESVLVLAEVARVVFQTALFNQRAPPFNCVMLQCMYRYPSLACAGHQQLSLFLIILLLRFTPDKEEDGDKQK